MNIKLDQNLPISLAEVFREFGHDAHSVLDEGLSGHSDAEVADAARKEGRMLVTLDRGFGDIRAYPPGSHSDVVVMRAAEQRPSVLAALVRAFLREHDLVALAGCNVVVQDDAVRVRRPAT